MWYIKDKSGKDCGVHKNKCLLEVSGKTVSECRVTIDIRAKLYTLIMFMCYIFIRYVVCLT